MTRRRYAIAELLPHAHEMLLLDEVDDYGDDWVRASLTVRTSDFFHEPGAGVPAWVGIEYMAQAIGVFDGIEQLRKGARPQIGLLIGSRKYVSEVDHFAAGERLLVSARMVLLDDGELAVFDCRIASGGVEVARAEVKAFRPADLQALLRESP